MKLLNYTTRTMILAGFLLLAVTSQAAAIDYYVSTSGSDSDTGLSDTQAWRTIQKAANSVTAGDTVHVVAGTYDEAITISENGTADNRIVFQGINNPVINALGEIGFKINGDYITVTGFTIRNAYYGVWAYRANYVNVSYNTMDDFSVTKGISIYGQSSAPYTPIYYPTVEYNLINTPSNAITLDYGVWGGSVSYNTLYSSNEYSETLNFYGVGSVGSEDPPAYGWKYYMNFLGNTIRGGRNGFGGGDIYKCNIASNNIAGYYHNGLNLHSTQYSIMEDNLIGESKGGTTQHAIYIDGSTHYGKVQTFKNNHIESASTGCGININNVMDGTVENLSIDYSGGEGIIVITNNYQGVGITASGNWSFRNVSLNTNAFSGIRFAEVDSTVLSGDYRFADIKIDGANLISGWTFDGAGVKPDVDIINTNNVTTRWISGATGGEFRFYYPLDVQVVDKNGNPIFGATVTINNNIDSNYHSINYKFENKTSFTTGNNGHTPLPSDAVNSAAILDFWKTSTTQQEMTYTLTASYSGYSNSTTVTSGTSWYRENPNTYQNTVTIILPMIITQDIDLNADGVINILDIVIVAQHFGESTISPYPSYDINSDGSINILDIRLVAEGM